MPSGLVMPGQKIVSLVKSTKASQLVNIGSGFKITTRDVEDVLATDAAALGIDNLKNRSIIYVYPGEPTCLPP